MSDCWASPTRKHELALVFIGGYDHYRCTHCGQTSYLRWDGTFAWEGFRGLEPPTREDTVTPWWTL